eukprot:661732-Pleurochrysis_carterae.AAC.5
MVHHPYSLARGVASLKRPELPCSPVAGRRSSTAVGRGWSLSGFCSQTQMPLWAGAQNLKWHLCASGGRSAAIGLSKLPGHEMIPSRVNSSAAAVPQVIVVAASTKGMPSMADFSTRCTTFKSSAISPHPFEKKSGRREPPSFVSMKSWSSIPRAMLQSCVRNCIIGTSQLPILEAVWQCQRCQTYLNDFIDWAPASSDGFLLKQ